MIESKFKLRCDECKVEYPYVSDDIEDLKMFALDDGWKRSIKSGSPDMLDFCPDCYINMVEREKREFWKKKAQEGKTEFQKLLDAEVESTDHKAKY